MQSFIKNTGKLNLHLFPILFPESLLGYLNSPPSPNSLFGDGPETLFSQSQSLNFEINNTDTKEGQWGISCFLCIAWISAASHTLPVILEHFGVGIDGSSPPSKVSKLFTQKVVP